MSDETAMAELDAWIIDLCAVVDIDPELVDRDAVLALAGRAAHAVVRPAAPVTTYVAGFVAGTAAARGGDSAEALARTIALIQRHLEV